MHTVHFCFQLLESTHQLLHTAVGQGTCARSLWELTGVLMLVCCRSMGSPGSRGRHDSRHTPQTVSECCRMKLLLLMMMMLMLLGGVGGRSAGDRVVGVVLA